MMYKIYAPAPWGRRLVGICHANRMESVSEDPDNPYCTTFKTRFLATTSGEWLSIWSDTLSWECAA